MESIMKLINVIHDHGTHRIHGKYIPTLGFALSVSSVCSVV